MKENHWLRDHWLILLTGVVVDPHRRRESEEHGLLHRLL